MPPRPKRHARRGGHHRFVRRMRSSSLVTGRAVSPADRFLPISKNTFGQVKYRLSPPRKPFTIIDVHYPKILPHEHAIW